MAWNKIDIVGADNVNAALLSRSIDNAAERWVQRLGMSCISWDPRDPVDVGSIVPRLYVIPEVQIRPGAGSIKIRLRHKVTQTSGVQIKAGFYLGHEVALSAPTTLVSTAADVYEVTVDIAEWMRINDPSAVRMTLCFEILSLPSGITQQLAINSVSAARISTTTRGITDPLICAAIGLSNLTAGKSASLTADEVPGGPVQIIRNGGFATAGGGVAGYQWYLYPRASADDLDAGIDAAVGDFNLYGQPWTHLDMEFYARIQFWAVSVEQIASGANVLTGLGRGPLIVSGEQSKLSLRPGYPARAVTHRPIYAECERMHEVQTTIHSQGPYTGIGGKSVLTPTSGIAPGSWACYPSVAWWDASKTRKKLFGCRIGDHLEYRAPGDVATRTRRALTITMSLIIFGGEPGENEIQIGANVLANNVGPPASVVYTSPGEPVYWDGWNPMVEHGDDTSTDDLCGSSLAFPRDVFGSGAADGRYRRNNLQGLWDTPELAPLRRRMISVTLDVLDGGTTTHSDDPLSLTVWAQPAEGGSVPVAAMPHAVRVWVAGWSVVSKTGGPPESVGV